MAVKTVDPRHDELAVLADKAAELEHEEQVERAKWLQHELLTYPPHDVPEWKPTQAWLDEQDKLSKELAAAEAEAVKANVSKVATAPTVPPES